MCTKPADDLGGYVWIHEAAARILRSSHRCT
jgi:hypothetical protein